MRMGSGRPSSRLLREPSHSSSLRRAGEWNGRVAQAEYAVAAHAAQAPLTLPEEPPPPPPSPSLERQYQVPVFEQPAEGSVDVKSANGRVSLVARNTPLSQVVSMLAQSQGVNIVCAQDINATVSIVLRDVAWNEALTAVLSTAGYTWARADGIIRVTSVAGGKNLTPDVQGRIVQVFALDYASGVEMEKAIKGLLSPVGQVFESQSSNADTRKPKDVLVVEDLPGFVARIANYVAQLDRPPRQVLVEAQVLEVKLASDLVHGVNWKNLFSMLNNQVELQMTGMADPLAPQAFFTKIYGGNLESLLECLKATQNTKTLASPRVLVVDGQEANIQVGEQLGYKVTTTTETSTMQDVRFLEVGVILTVTPHIARDGRVWMKVMPKVSTGRINPQTQLPEEKTSQVTSQVLLDDNQGIIIGGLIQEKDSTDVQKFPILGDIWLVGSLFQRRKVEKFRTETVIALVPHVQPFNCAVAERDRVDLLRCQTPLLQPNERLDPVPRPWEPQPPSPFRPPACLHKTGEQAAAASGPTPPEPIQSPQPEPMAPPLPDARGGRFAPQPTTAFDGAAAPLSEPPPPYAPANLAAPPSMLLPDNTDRGVRITRLPPVSTSVR